MKEREEIQDDNRELTEREVRGERRGWGCASPDVRDTVLLAPVFPDPM